jgi:hypothetical protein
MSPPFVFLELVAINNNARALIEIVSRFAILLFSHKIKVDL